MVFLSEVSEYIIKRILKVLVGEVSGERQPAIFDKTPQDLNEIELRAIGWQRVEKKFGFFPLRDACFKSAAGVPRGLIQHHPSGPGERLARGIKTDDDHLGIDPSLKTKGCGEPWGERKPKALIRWLLALGTSIHRPTGWQV